MDSRNANHNHKQQFIKTSKSILTSQQTFISNKQNVFTEDYMELTRLHGVLTIIKECS